jgi:ATP-dependent Lon protease
MGPVKPRFAFVEINRKDLAELSEEVRKKLEFVFLQRVDDAITAALEQQKAEDGVRTA